MVGMPLGIDDLIEGEVGQRIGLVALLQEVCQTQIALAAHFIGGKPGARNDVGHEVECRA